MTTRRTLPALALGLLLLAAGCSDPPPERDPRRTRSAPRKSARELIREAEARAAAQRKEWDRRRALVAAALKDATVTVRRVQWAPGVSPMSRRADHDGARGLVTVDVELSGYTEHISPHEFRIVTNPAIQALPLALEETSGMALMGIWSSKAESGEAPVTPQTALAGVWACPTAILTPDGLPDLYVRAIPDAPGPARVLLQACIPTRPPALRLAYAGSWLDTQPTPIAPADPDARPVPSIEDGTGARDL